MFVFLASRVWVLAGDVAKLNLALWVQLYQNLTTSPTSPGVTALALADVVY